MTSSPSSTEHPGSNDGPPAPLEETSEGMVSIDIPTTNAEDRTQSNAKRGSAYGTAIRLPRLVPESATLESTERPTYWRRRLDLWDQNGDDDDEDVPRAPRPKFMVGSISSLPIPLQVGFRRKMISIFVLQLLLLTGFLTILTFESTLSTEFNAFFQETLYILVALAIMIALLTLLYSVHAMFPLNWIVLLIFTAGMSVFLAALQILINSHACLFCCAFTLVAMCVMVGFSGVRRKGENSTLLSSSIAGLLSFAATAVGALILFGIFGTELISSAGLAYSIVLELVLIMWFSHDANTMYSLISPDEYMNGVIYFYTDLVVLTIISLFFGAVILFCSACGTASGFGYCDFYACMHTGGGAGPGGDCDDEDMEGDEAAGDGDGEEVSGVAVSEDNGNNDQQSQATE